MDAVLWRRAGELFEAALDRPAGASRRRFVAEAAGEDRALRLEVDRLLAADAATTGWPGRPARSAETANESRIGPYRLLGVLGRGGMATVHLAARDDRLFERLVAVKVVRRDLGNPEIARRFVAERQLLAELEHPGIARLYDGGTTDDGRPYLVLEVVDGEPITTACDRLGLGVEARLRLVLGALDAVEHAHRRGVVHRDLKPSNVLVTGEGEVKLLDFGIAAWRSTASEEPPELAGARRWSTPTYASPEQRRGALGGPESDVYSLGVLLHVLLAPGRGLRGDLGAIVAKASADDPARRYVSAADLAADLRRHLDGRAVRARGDGWAYRASVAARRHRRAMVAVAIGGLLLAGLAIETARRGARVGVERASHRETAHELAGLLVDAAPRVDPEPLAIGGAGRWLDLAFSRARAVTADGPGLRVAVLDAFGRIVHQAGDSRRGQEVLAAALAARRASPETPPIELTDSQHDLGAVEVSRGGVDTGMTRLASALGERLELVGEDDVRVAESWEAIGLAHWHRGDLAAAETALRASLESRGAACGGPDYWAADALGHLAALAAATGRLDEAESWVDAARSRRALEGERRAHQAEHLEHRAMLAAKRADYLGAEHLYREALVLRRADVAEAAAVDAERRVATTLHDLARAQGERGAYDASQATFAEALALERHLSGEPTPALATLLNNLAIVLGRSGRTAAAEEMLRRVLEMRRRMLGDEHPHVAQARFSLGWLLHDQGDLDAAIPLYLEAADGVDRLPPDHPARAYPRVAIARWWLDSGRPAIAERELVQALAILRAGHVAGHWRIAEAESLLGTSLLRQERRDEATTLLRAAVASIENQRGVDSPRARQARARLAELDS